MRHAQPSQPYALTLKSWAMNEINETLSRYAELKVMVASAEKEIEEMQDWIIGYMQGKDTSEIVHPRGKFKINQRQGWKYSDEVKKSEAEVKLLKKSEEANGKAQSSTSNYLSFKAT
jgi:hypothetical protein